MEIWKNIDGYIGYQISNLCRVKSLARKVKRAAGLYPIKERIMKQHIHRDGYYYVVLHLKGQQKAMSTHRLISIAFIPNPENKSQVNHKNFLKHCNRVDNLEWVTPLENTHHYISSLK